MPTMQDLINRTIKRLSQIGGVSTGLYSDEIIMECLQHKFDVLFDLAWWPQFLGQDLTTLDGASGVVTSNYTNVIKRFQDIGSIYLGSNPVPLNALPRQRNGYSQYSGYIPYNNPAKVFKVVPATLTGRICVNYRTKPDSFNLDDEVSFDDQALILGAAYDFLESDGSNPGDAAKLKSMFEARVKQLLGANESKSIHFGIGSSGYAGDFYVV